MAITLTIEPGVSVSWNEFKKQSGGYGIALDGYVTGPTRFDQKGPNQNFDHHIGVDRYATRATCAQVLIAIRLGLLRRFWTNGSAHARVFLNHCDEDACLSWYLLRNYHLAENPINPLLNKLVAIEDAMDTSAGTYPYPIDLPTLRRAAWVFEPYYRFKTSGGIERKNAFEQQIIVEAVSERLSAYVNGESGQIPLNDSYEVLKQHGNWVVIREVGANARMSLYKKGVEAFLSVRQRADGKYDYSIGIVAPFIGVDLLRTKSRLSRIDARPWGGATTIIASSREGSDLMPSDVIAEMKKDFG